MTTSAQATVEVSSVHLRPHNSAAPPFTFVPHWRKSENTYLFIDRWYSYKGGKKIKRSWAHDDITSNSGSENEKNVSGKKKNTDKRDTPVKRILFYLSTCCAQPWVADVRIKDVFQCCTKSKEKTNTKQDWGFHQSARAAGETWCFFCKTAKSWKDRLIWELRINQGLSPSTAAQIRE